MKRSQMIREIMPYMPRPPYYNERAADKAQYESAERLLSEIEKLGMIPPLTYKEKRADGVLWMVEAYEWDAENEDSST